ncbi:Inositolphosphorylceramide synthase subunit Kei1-domain-containing protein [Scheffersomyces xylosifermentans]|uniref:Inositolphosphorylceramide synthase subunit Kei1-domain-containing protein n=1 Tax=Scheffersomyces xylosifermentans TaxID=1304137 RepID=UPI00315D1D18
MTIASSLNQILPQRFLGFIPLFIGVEVVLGITILNKAGGVYGILSIITGHPLNFWQWFYNILAIMTIPFYISALIHLKDKPRNARKLSLATVVYVIDTFVGFFYTIYFIYFWFSSEDVSEEDLGKRASSTNSQDLSAQSASLARELYVTASTTIVVSAVRFYFTLVILSFTKALLKQDASEQKYNERTRSPDEEDEEVISATTGIVGEWKKFVFDLEIKSKDFLVNFFK